MNVDLSELVLQIRRIKHFTDRPPQVDIRNCCIEVHYRRNKVTLKVLWKRLKNSFNAGAIAEGQIGALASLLVSRKTAAGAKH